MQVENNYYAIVMPKHCQTKSTISNKTNIPSMKPELIRLFISAAVYLYVIGLWVQFTGLSLGWSEIADEK